MKSSFIFLWIIAFNCRDKSLLLFEKYQLCLRRFPLFVEINPSKDGKSGSIIFKLNHKTFSIYQSFCKICFTMNSTNKSFIWLQMRNMVFTCILRTSRFLLSNFFWVHNFRENIRYYDIISSCSCKSSSNLFCFESMENWIIKLYLLALISKV